MAGGVGIFGNFVDSERRDMPLQLDLESSVENRRQSCSAKVPEVQSGNSNMYRASRGASTFAQGIRGQHTANLKFDFTSANRSIRNHRTIAKTGSSLVEPGTSGRSIGESSCVPLMICKTDDLFNYANSDDGSGSQSAILKTLTNVCTIPSTFHPRRRPQYGPFVDPLDAATSFHHHPVRDSDIDAISTPAITSYYFGNIGYDGSSKTTTCENAVCYYPAAPIDRQSSIVPNATPKPGSEPTTQRILGGDVERLTYGVFVLVENLAEDLHARWRLVTEDFIRQSRIPVLESGHTVIRDERNYKPLKQWPKIQPTKIPLTTALIHLDGLVLDTV